jgi:hypothetical protein
MTERKGMRRKMHGVKQNVYVKGVFLFDYKFCKRMLIICLVWGCIL